MIAVGNEDRKILITTRDWVDDPNVAIARLNSYLAKNPGSVLAKIRLAQIFSGGYGEGVHAAERVLREVLRSEPGNAIALTFLALLHGRPGSELSLSESLDLFRKAADISNEPWALENLGNKAWDSGMYDVAFDAFIKLREIAGKRGMTRLSEIAAKSVQSVRFREKPTSLHYSVPFFA